VTDALEDRLARLEAIAAIDALKARYTALADAKYTPEHRRVPPEEWARVAQLQADCFTEDAIWIAEAAFGGSRTGRPALADWFTRSPWRFALHFYLAPAFSEIGPHSARASWRLWQLAIPETATTPVLLAGITHEAYRRDASGWRIAEMRFAELHRVDLAQSPALLDNLMPTHGPFTANTRLPPR